jgi:hypothetical protein
MNVGFQPQVIDLEEIAVLTNLKAVALKNGEVWVVDPCAAWRGYRSPLSYWDEFMSKRVVRVKHRGPLGNMAKQYAKDPWDTTNPYSMYIGLQERFIAGFCERECGYSRPATEPSAQVTAQMLQGTRSKFEKKLYSFAKDFDTGLAIASQFLYSHGDGVGGFLVSPAFEHTFVKILVGAGVYQEDILDEDPCDTKGLYNHFV